MQQHSSKSVICYYEGYGCGIRVISPPPHSPSLVFLHLPLPTPPPPPPPPPTPYSYSSTSSPSSPSSPLPLPSPILTFSPLLLYSHYWVVALKASDSFDASVNPLALYPNNNSFVFYSNMPAVGQPYIVAEISAANYTSARRFLLGSREANKYNDIMAYDNGPLEQSTLYTVFVWGFSPIPQVHHLLLLVLVLLCCWCC